MIVNIKMRSVRSQPYEIPKRNIGGFEMPKGNGVIECRKECKSVWPIEWPPRDPNVQRPMAVVFPFVVKRETAEQSRVTVGGPGTRLAEQIQGESTRLAAAVEEPFDWKRVMPRIRRWEQSSSRRLVSENPELIPSE